MGKEEGDVRNKGADRLQAAAEAEYSNGSFEVKGHLSVARL